jgi:hypothetical protein
MTELAPQPMRRAASLNEQPESTKDKARRRRSSSRSALPFGLGIGAGGEQSTYIIEFFLEESYYILYTWLNSSTTQAERMTRLPLRVRQSDLSSEHRDCSDC